MTITLFEKLKLYVSLLRRFPKNFIYTLFFSPRTIVTIKPYDHYTFIQAQRLIKKLRTIIPESRVYLFGSTGLKIAGRGDIDLFVTVSKIQFETVISKLAKLYGEPSHVEDSLIEWRFIHNEIPVEIALLDPKSSRFKDQALIFSLLKNNSQLLKEYENLKLRLDKSTELIYDLWQMDFIERLLSEAK